MSFLSGSDNAAPDGFTWIAKTANYTMQDHDGVLADSTAGPFNLMLPPAGNVGHKVAIMDGAPAGSWATNNVSVVPDGTNLLDGVNANFVLDVDNGWVEIIDDGTEWIVRTEFAGQPQPGITLGTPTTTTSGTSHDYNGIPAGTKKVTVMFSGISTNGSSKPIIQLGDSAGIETTGYNGTATDLGASTIVTSALSAGFRIRRTWASAKVAYGAMTLTLMDATNNIWAMSCTEGNTDGTGGASAGTKSLTGELTQLRLTTEGGTDTFDAGSFNIQYE